MARVLVLSPHPDDEAIGCGGTLRRHVEQGDEVRVLFLTSGEKGGHSLPAEEVAPQREREAHAAAAILGVSELSFWREPDGGLRATRGLEARLAEIVRAWPAAVVYVPHDREMHPDHRAATRLLRRTLARPDLMPYHPDVLMFELWTPLQEMDEIVDITPFIEIKLAAIRAHASQCAVLRFDEATLGLNRYRGEMHSWPGGEYAEIFKRMRL